MATHNTGRIPNLVSVTVSDTDGNMAEWFGGEIQSISVKVTADIDNLPHPIYLAMGGCSIDSPVDALTTVTYGRAAPPPYNAPILRGIDSESIIEAMTQLGYGLGAEEADALRKACRIVDDGGPFYDDDEGDDV